MLELRPNCELCDKDLPPQSQEACICTYECTFCADCVRTILENVCPNCGGGFVPRPLRPQSEHRKEVSLTHHPASTKRINTKYSLDEIKEFVGSVKHLKPEER